MYDTIAHKLVTTFTSLSPCWQLSPQYCQNG
jgi:hypothetical protein